MKNLFSGPLFKENLKRFWGFAAVVFMAYFLATNFIVLTSNNYSIAQNVRSLVSIASFGYLFWNGIAPICSAVIVFSYLSKVNSTTAMHIMPFSRTSLFITNYISGLALVIIPLLLNSVISVVLKYTVVAKAIAVVGSDASLSLLTISAIIKTFLWNALCILFTYSISVLAAIFTGNSVIHFLTACAMNIILPVLWIVMQGYGAFFLYGYEISDSMWSICSYLHPDFYGFIRPVRDFGLQTGEMHVSTVVSPVAVIGFTFAAVIITILAFVFYKNRKLETAGDSYVFKFIRYIIAFIFTFIPATGLAFLLSSDGLNLWIGLAIGGVVGFIIGWMIINKTFRIFNFDALKTFIICAIICLGIVFGFKLDIFGYEKKIPKLDDIEYVTYNSSYINDGRMDDKIISKESIQSLQNIHKQVIDSQSDDRNENCYSFSIDYYLKNGKLISRKYYMVPVALFKDNADFKKLYESNGITQQADELKLFANENTTVNIFSNVEYQQDSSLLLEEINHNNQFKLDLVNALIKDFQERTYEEAISHKIGYLQIQFEREVPKKEQATFDYSYDLSYFIDVYPVKDGQAYLYDTSISINDTYEHTIEVLNKYNVLDRFLPSENTGFIYIQKYDSEKGYGRIEPSYEYMGVDAPESKQGVVVISDSELQQDIIRKACHNYDCDNNEDLLVRYMSYGIEYVTTENGETQVKKTGSASEQLWCQYIDYQALPDEVKSLISQYL